MIHKPLLVELFKAAYMQRWNDHLRPCILCELDKQAHKMIVAYVLGKHEQALGTPGFDWNKVIESGIFEFLQRSVITDIKPPLFYKIKQDKKKYAELNAYVYAIIAPLIHPIEQGAFLQRFKSYLIEDEHGSEDINKALVRAAHLYATVWEFQLIERANPSGYDIPNIREELTVLLEETYHLGSMQQLVLSRGLKSFVDMCAELRFQIRWNHLHRIPQTSVLGHMLIVAMISYFFSLDVAACPRRCFNNYFTALFHDLPEVLTRDVVSPVKRSVYGLDVLIKRFEQEEMKKIYALLPDAWKSEMHMFTENEFSSLVTVKKTMHPVASEIISKRYNHDQYNPRDGAFVETADKLAAFVEAFLALENGIKNKELADSVEYLQQLYHNATLCSIPIGKIFEEFTDTHL